MTKRSPSIDRAVRIELLRARGHRARIPGPGHRQRRPQAGAGLAHQGPAARAGIEQCVTLGLAGHRPGAPLSTGQLVAVRHVHAGRQALSPVESRGGRAGGLAAVENLAGSERQGPGRALSSRPASAVFLKERHPGNRMAFLLACLRRGGMPRIGIGAHDRAASQGSSWMQKSTLPAAPLSRPPVAPALSWKSHRRMPAVPVLGAEGDCCRRWAASRPGRRACWCRRSR